MIITIQVSLPMTDAQGIKESVAARLEDMGSVVRVVDIRDDGYGKQQSFMGNQTEDDARVQTKQVAGQKSITGGLLSPEVESDFPETAAYIQRMLKDRERRKRENGAVEIQSGR